MKKAIIILSILAIVSISCNEEVTAPQEPVNETHSYSNSELGFKISVPEGWELEENVNVGGYEALLVGRKTEYSGFQPKFNIICQDIGFQLDANSLLQASEQNLPNMFSELEFDSKRVINIDDFQCAEIVFHHNYNGTLLKQKQILFMCQPTKFIVITFDSAMNEYVRNRGDFNTIQKSIKKL